MICVRVELNDGTTSLRGIPDLDHDTICRAFSLDPVGTRIDLPRSARDRDPSSNAARKLNGIIFRHGEPIGTLNVAYEHERFRDVDPRNPADRLELR